MERRDKHRQQKEKQREQKIKDDQAYEDASHERRLPVRSTWLIVAGAALVTLIVAAWTFLMW